MTASIVGSLICIAAAPPSHHVHKTPARAAAKQSIQSNQWNLATDEVDANLQTGDFSAPHHVLATRADGSTVDADRGTGNYKKRFFSLFGGVKVHDESGTFGGLNGAQNTSHTPSTLSCDELHVDNVSKMYHAIGDVHYVQGSNLADAQEAQLDDRSHELSLQGKVHVVEGDRTLDADRATYNTSSGEGQADGDVKMLFPGAINASIATPKPIVIKNPKIPH